MNNSPGNGNQPKPKNTREFVAGIILSIVVLSTIFFFGPYSIILWFLFLVVFLSKKKNSVALGMGVGILISIFIFLIICGGLIFGYGS